MAIQQSHCEIWQGQRHCNIIFWHKSLIIEILCKKKTHYTICTKIQLTILGHRNVYGSFFQIFRDLNNNLLFLYESNFTYLRTSGRAFGQRYLWRMAEYIAQQSDSACPSYFDCSIYTVMLLRWYHWIPHTFISKECEDYLENIVFEICRYQSFKIFFIISQVNSSQINNYVKQWTNRNKVTTVFW